VGDVHSNADVLTADISRFLANAETTPVEFSPDARVCPDFFAGKSDSVPFIERLIWFSSEEVTEVSMI
jgi:hypothetical protein